jgi:hypothetical protein
MRGDKRQPTRTCQTDYWITIQRLPPMKNRPMAASAQLESNKTSVYYSLQTFGVKSIGLVGYTVRWATGDLFTSR